MPALFFLNFVIRYKYTIYHGSSAQISFIEWTSLERAELRKVIRASSELRKCQVKWEQWMVIGNLFQLSYVNEKKQCGVFTKTKQRKENGNTRCICDRSRWYIQFYIFPTSLKYVHRTISWSLLLPPIHQVSFGVRQVATLTINSCIYGQVKKTTKSLCENRDLSLLFSHQ